MKTINVTDGDVPWETPLPIDAATPPLPFSVEHLPGWLRRYVTEISEANQTPLDAAGMLARSIRASKPLSFLGRGGGDGGDSYQAAGCSAESKPAVRSLRFENGRKLTRSPNDKS